jgi:hypothetical protein
VNSEHWIEMKRADFLNALQLLKPTARITSALERELQIGLIKGQAVFSVQGASESMEASGSWAGIACTKLAFFLPFLAVKPAASDVRIIFQDGAIFVCSARFPAKWAESNERETAERLSQHKAMPAKENILKFKCRQCHKKQGVALDSLEYGPFSSEEVRRLFEAAELVNHGFGCLSCGMTWMDQVA